MTPKAYRYGWILVLLALASAALACNALKRAADNVEQVQTVQAIATTGQEIATQVQGIATEVSESGALETAQAMATEFEDSGMLETVQVAVTEIASGEGPENIPIIEGETSNFIGTSSLVSYTTTLDFDQVKSFYEQQMPAYGWQTGDDLTISSPTYAVLSYQNAEQEAMVTLSTVGNNTVVLINITPK